MRILPVAVVVLTGCGVRGDLPSGVTCSRWTQARGEAALAQALAAATSGTCVVAQTGKYQQALSVPQGVTLVGESTGAVELAGGSDMVPVVTLAPNVTVQEAGPRSAAHIPAISSRTDSARVSCAGVISGRGVRPA